MKIRLGPDAGNSGAVLRWGKYLDNGIWIRVCRFKRLWFNWKFQQGYIDCGIFVIQWGN